MWILFEMSFEIYMYLIKTNPATIYNLPRKGSDERCSMFRHRYVCGNANHIYLHETRRNDWITANSHCEGRLRCQDEEYSDTDSKTNTLSGSRPNDVNTKIRDVCASAYLSE